MFIRKRIAPAFLVIAAAIIFMMILGTAPAHAEEKTIGAVYVTCNAEQWYIMLNKNGNDNYYRIRDYLDVRGAGVEYTNSGNLTKRSIERQFWGVNSDPIVPEGEYYISFRLRPGSCHRCGGTSGLFQWVKMYRGIYRELSW